MNTKCNFIYFPLAGASSLTFRKIGTYFDQSFNPICYDYPGHGSRISENYAQDINSLSKDACDYIIKNADLDNYFIGGHCIGAVLAYEICKKLADKNVKLPEKIIVSGHGAPDRVVSEKLGMMSDDELLEYLCQNELCDRSMTDLKFRKMVQGLILDPIRKDSDIYDKYVCSQGKIDCGIEVLYGEDDDRFPEDTLNEWERYTSVGIKLHKFKGNHYFPTKNEKEYFERINQLIYKQ